MKKRLQAACAAVGVVILAGCAPSTPATRISKNPVMFANLPRGQQELVEQGQIERGMPPEAVFLAWGNPDRRSEGADGNSSTMSWIYTGLTPVYNTGFYGRLGYGGWGCGGRGYYSSLGVAPTIQYVPEQRASVYFIDQRVEAWERAR